MDWQYSAVEFGHAGMMLAWWIRNYTAVWLLARSAAIRGQLLAFLIAGMGYSTSRSLFRTIRTTLSDNWNHLVPRHEEDEANSGFISPKRSFQLSDKIRLFGQFEPLCWTNSTSFDYNRVVRILQKSGLNSLRVWMVRLTLNLKKLLSHVF